MWVLVLITMIGGKFDGAKAFDVNDELKAWGEELREQTEKDPDLI